jgi:hypothetical protein
LEQKTKALVSTSDKITIMDEDIIYFMEQLDLFCIAIGEAMSDGSLHCHILQSMISAT